MQKYNKYKEQGNILVLNCGPNREGKIEQADIDSLYAAARMLGIASGDALKKTYSDVLGEYKGENLALNAAAESNQNYTGSGSENHMPEKMFDGNTDSSGRRIQAIWSQWQILRWTVKKHSII